jgi:hypothetical protein
MKKFKGVYMKIINIINEILIMLFGKRLNTIHVIEFPKCGGTWVSNVLRSYLQVDKKNGTTRLLKTNSVIQKHSKFKFYFRKNVIVYREPKDVFTSFYFHEIYFRNKKEIRFFRDLYNYSETDNDFNNFNRYLSAKIEFPRKSIPYFSYQDFYDSWKEIPKVEVKYECLKKDPVKEFRKILQYLGIMVDEIRLKNAIEKNSFQNISQREVGEENKYSHLRKGTVGDWKNVFAKESVEKVNINMTKLIRDLGYENINS